MHRHRQRPQGAVAPQVASKDKGMRLGAMLAGLNRVAPTFAPPFRKGLQRRRLPRKTRVHALRAAPAGLKGKMRCPVNARKGL